MKQIQKVLTSLLVHIYIYCMYTFCSHPHTPLSLSNKLKKGKGDKVVSLVSRYILSSVVLDTVFLITLFF